MHKYRHATRENSRRRCYKLDGPQESLNRGIRPRTRTLLAAALSHRSITQLAAPPIRTQTPRGLSPEAETLGDLWSDATNRYGSHVALRANYAEVSYAELDIWARRLAADLSQAGLQTGETCGIYLERSIECVVSMIAITLYGANWLPLDPAYPAPRLRFMARDAGVKHIISDGDPTALQLSPATRVLEPRTVKRSLDETTLHRFGSRAESTDDAYLIYTSGSTGQPKGIPVEHAALVAFLRSMQALLPAQALSHVVSITSPCFDISLLEVFLPLVCGGTVSLATRAEALDGRLLAKRLRAERPSLVQATPTNWRMLLATGWQGHAGLTIISGGEAIDVSTVAQLLDRADSVWNLYGPTEATIWATAAQLTSADVEAGVIPIGSPLAHVDTLIVDATDNSSTSYTGELCLLGTGVARGYLHNPILSAEKFVELPNGRAYRTGDRVSRSVDGQLIFHGRIDDQVKVNGHRIEPAEVESVIRTHAQIADVAVTVKDVAGEGTRLVAYLVAHDFDPDERRSQRLTEHWQAIWTHEYVVGVEHVHDPTFNTAGLRSSYDDQPLDESVLRELVDNTCERARAFQPERVLDLGCGTGLVLLALAPECEHYVGVDFSRPAIDGLKREVAHLGLSNVDLLEQSVDTLANIDKGTFDVVLLNTVIQYFPDTRYLETVLDNAIEALRPAA